MTGTRVGPLVGLCVSSVVTSTGGGELESLDGEGEVLVIWVVHQEPVIDGLLDTLSLVAGRHQRTGLPSSATLLNTGRLSECLVVSLHPIHYDPPLAGSVEGTKGHQVTCGARTQVSLLGQLYQAVNTVFSVSKNILVECGHPSIVVLDGVGNLVGGILGVLQAPGLGGVGGAGGRSHIFGGCFVLGGYVVSWPRVRCVAVLGGGGVAVVLRGVGGGGWSVAIPRSGVVGGVGDRSGGIVARGGIVGGGGGSVYWHWGRGIVARGMFWAGTRGWGGVLAQTGGEEN
jgi:hypothetical protein